MPARVAALATLLAATASALEVHMKGIFPHQLASQQANLAVQSGAIWGGMGNLASLPGWLNKADIDYYELQSMMPGDYLTLTADDAPKTAVGGVPAPTTCDSVFILAVYGCGDPACAAQVHGMLPQKLLADGWEKRVVGPQFTLLFTGVQLHDTVVYVKTVPAGQTYSMPSPDSMSQYNGLFAAGCGVTVTLPPQLNAPNLGPSRRPYCADNCPVPSFMDLGF
eukprot:TRINITY_DN307_c0_g1_i1.p1 TRINITY_DN307_c0_g1~~TRINITY_DN307_c0_g1_i1.p1  ORF type:complete len:223 (+),score=64.37 TRINITY_DN307_c0_g1_i1:60-728(+)